MGLRRCFNNCNGECVYKTWTPVVDELPGCLCFCFLNRQVGVLWLYSSSSALLHKPGMV